MISINPSLLHPREEKQTVSRVGGTHCMLVEEVNDASLLLPPLLPLARSRSQESGAALRTF